MEMQTAAPSTPPKISMAMLRELKAALPDDDDDYEVVPPKVPPPALSPARGSAFDKRKVVEASFNERLSGADAAAELSRKHLSTGSLEQSRERFEAANRAIDAWQQAVVETTSIRPEVAAVHAARSREEAKQDYIKDSVATISPEQARAKIEAVNRAAAAGQHDVVEASFNEMLSAADAAVMDEAAREYAKQNYTPSIPAARTDGPPSNVVTMRPTAPAPASATQKPEAVSESDYAAKTAAAIAASGLGAAAAAAAVNAASAAGQPTQAAKPQQGTIHLNPSVTRGEPKVAAPRSSPRAQAKAKDQAAAAENGQAYDREATAAERALMLGMKPFMSMFGKKPKAVGLSDEMIKQWQGGLAAAALKEASLSAADTHSTLTNLPKDAVKGDVEAAANKATDTVAKFEAAAQSAGLMKDPLAKEQMLSNVKAAAEQFSKTLDGGKEKFGDAFNCEAMMKQMKEMADKIAEMMAKVAEAIQSVVPGPKR